MNQFGYSIKIKQVVSEMFVKDHPDDSTDYKSKSH